MRRRRQRRRLRAPGPVPRLLAAKLGTTSAPLAALLHPTPSPQASPAPRPPTPRHRKPRRLPGGRGEVAGQAGLWAGYQGLGRTQKSGFQSTGSPSPFYPNS